jgi:hypothetical protein
MGGVGIFLIISAVIVLFPVLMQLRQGESRIRDVWGYLVFIAGLILVAVGDSALAPELRLELAIAGVISALAGLLIQSRLSQSSNPAAKS